MSEQTHLSAQPLKPSRIGVIVAYLVYTAVIVRALGTIGIRNLWPAYLGLLSAHLVLFTERMLSRESWHRGDRYGLSDGRLRHDHQRKGKPKARNTSLSHL